MLRFSWDKLNLENPKIKIMQDECENFETYLGHLFKSISKMGLEFKWEEENMDASA